MNQANPVTAETCPVGYAACPGTHLCLFRSAGAWKSCSLVVEHVQPQPESPPSRNGQEMAA